MGEAFARQHTCFGVRRRGRGSYQPVHDAIIVISKGGLFCIWIGLGMEDGWMYGVDSQLDQGNRTEKEKTMLGGIIKALLSVLGRAFLSDEYINPQMRSACDLMLSTRPAEQQKSVS